ncbi:MAG TPA: HDOD domain-containing protein [Burkholderiaceae bacterium]|nr:HDOD domain-containing protein [Burkholderiaceae bacterium]
MPTTAPTPIRANPTRSFGRFALRQLLGKSAATMVWLAFDPRSGAEVMLTLPRVQPTDAIALEHWQRDAGLAARLHHPNLAPVAELGVQDHWPFVAVERALGVTLGEWLAQHPNPKPAEAVGWVCDLLHGLAFAHEAGIAHLDLQLHSLLINERGGVSLMALCAAGDAARVARDAARARSLERTMALDPGELRARRAVCARDLLAAGVLLHRLLTGQPALDQPDTALVLARIAPLGREIVRLPWSTPLPIPEALRAIANRCTAGQERLRYQSPRTLLGALSGWLDAQSEDGGGPLGLLLDRLHSVGHLPALPGLAARVARVTALESQRTDEIADQVLADMALSFELLRTLNSAQVQGTQVQGNGPVLTLRRIISLIGINGVRLAANTLRAWPGPLSAPHAAALQLTFDRVRLAGHVAQALRPAGYDAQVVYLIAVLQNLGRLMLRYHFAGEAEQIEQLTRPGSREPGTPEQPGLGEEAAAYAVLGIDIESLGAAVARQWGLGDDVMHMARRLPPEAPVRKPDTDAELLRLTASAANDAVDAVSTLTGARVAAALGQIAQRYARALGLSVRELSDALEAGREMLRKGTAPPAQRRGDPPPVLDADLQPIPAAR